GAVPPARGPHHRPGILRVRRRALPAPACRRHRAVQSLARRAGCHGARQPAGTDVRQPAPRARHAFRRAHQRRRRHRPAVPEAAAAAGHRLGRQAGALRRWHRRLPHQPFAEAAHGLGPRQRRPLRREPARVPAGGNPRPAEAARGGCLPRRRRSRADRCRSRRGAAAAPVPPRQPVAAAVRGCSMIGPRQLLRLARINYVLARHGLDEVILATRWFRPVRFLKYFSPWYWFRSREVPRGVRIRLVLEDLGPIFVKFGQMLSTRRDLIPHDIADELALLQDRVPPFPGELAVKIIERSLGQPIAELFERFDVEPLASASIAQVHAAELAGGKQVVVKVLRPDIERIIRRDLELMYMLAQLMERHWADGRRLRPVEVVAEYEKTILDELDLLREGANASQLRRNFRDSELLYVPEVYWQCTRRDVMVMERIAGIPVSDLQALRDAGTDMKTLSERGVEIFFTQVFEHNFFHADMHPGNIFVDVSDPERPKYIAVDFGIV